MRSKVEVIIFLLLILKQGRWGGRGWVGGKIKMTELAVKRITKSPPFTYFGVNMF